MGGGLILTLIRKASARRYWKRAIARMAKRKQEMTLTYDVDESARGNLDDVKFVVTCVGDAVK